MWGNVPSIILNFWRGFEDIRKLFVTTWGWIFGLRKIIEFLLSSFTFALLKCTSKIKVLSPQQISHVGKQHYRVKAINLPLTSNLRTWNVLFNTQIHSNFLSYLPLHFLSLSYTLDIGYWNGLRVLSETVSGWETKTTHENLMQKCQYVYRDIKLGILVFFLSCLFDFKMRFYCCTFYCEYQFLLSSFLSQSCREFEDMKEGKHTNKMKVKLKRKSE